MRSADSGKGDREIRAALADSGRLLAACGMFSMAVNVLMLTGPLFMLQIYDRVLSSRSEATLVTLAGLVAFLFLLMGVLDHARGRVLARVGARLQERLDPRVLHAIVVRSVAPAERSRPATGLSDLEAINRFASSAGAFTFFDAPWTPVFLIVLFLFHWMLGLLAVLSGGVLLAVALINQARTGTLQREAGEATAEAAHFIEQVRAGGETVQGLGMLGAVVKRTGELRRRLLDRTVAVSDRNGLYGVVTKTLRLFLQSMMLGLGAWLALRGEVTAGIVIAGSILLGRALAPIDQAVGNWPRLQRAVVAWRELGRLLSETPPEPARTALPEPRARLEAHSVTVAPPGARYAVVRQATLRVGPGQAAGIAGVSAAGKSTLARALAGVWRPLGGSVRLDGAELDHYGSAALGRHIGYLPQEVVLFEGTVAENIARMAPEPDAAAVVEAARRTGAHEMILGLPGGYDFQVAAGGAALSGGQRQRIALARAFYGRPVVVIMDEPDSNLDAEGTLALARAVRGLKARGGAAVIVAHRQGAFAQCDAVYLMENGRPVPARRRRRAAPAQQTQADGRQRVPARTRAEAVPAGRDKQIARAIERVVGARPGAAADHDDGPLAGADRGPAGAAPAEARHG
ncbi:MAG: type I secretion system permease/ATPase [Spirochaetaceae bacterium]|nr:type I secretion system permease/ATPase [Spirochaetaceae bacterium]